MSLKVIILDIDGTLVNSNGEMMPETKTTLIKAQEKGIKVILASGRPTSGIVDLGKELRMDEFNGLFVSYNGSKIIDFKTMETLFNQPLSVHEGKAVLEHMKQFDVFPMVDKGDHMHTNDAFGTIKFKGEDFGIVKYEARGNKCLLCEHHDLAEFLDYEVNKILVAGTPEYLQEHHEEMARPFKDTLSCMFTSVFYFEYTAKGIDKAAALDTVLAPMGYTVDEMIAFGDGMNDLSMLKYVGTGVAMENAVDEVKANAQFITASNDEEGIAKALYKYIPELMPK